MMKKLISILLFVISCSANAGYYAFVTSTTGITFKPSGTVSGCYLTLGMAIDSLTINGNRAHVNALDSVAKTWAGYAYSEGHWAAGAYGECQATPTGARQADFIGGLTDPAIVDGSVVSGGGSGGGTVTPEEPFDTVKASALFGFFFSFVVGVWLFAKNIGLILQAVKRW